MERKRRGVLAIKSLGARFFVLSFVCVPVFFPILRDLDVGRIVDHRIPLQIANLAPFIIYSVFLFCVISYTLGVSGLTRIISISATTAITVSVARGVIPQIPIVGSFLQGSKPDGDSSFSASLQLVEMFILIPAPIFFVRCFPPSDILLNIKSNRRGGFLIFAATVSRMSTAIADGISHFFVAWQEENPRFIFPRHSSELGSSQKLIKFPLWFFAAMKTWCFALVVYSLEQIPPLIYQTNDLILNKGKNND